ncbi:MAG TPA: amylo-alpha-1,6-glucosidase, partial [Candidatus Dormibacteraeota bacterium]|nr:amylo-alpha-1,6-glucosidase [Candidatus Dormibacteraeota bacterium]
SAQLDRGANEADWIGGDGWSTEARSDSYLLDAVLARSLDDLRLLRASIDGLPYYEAGIPWFATLFGRDSIIASLQTLAFDTSVAKGTLRLLASMQGTRSDDWRDEQPGKILHELRIGELARIGAIPHTPYYGTIDATPLFLVLLERYVAWTGDLDLFRELRDHVDRAVEWLDRWADPDGDGFVDYQSEQGHGLVNQGWKDSGDGIVDGKGRIATPPIALAEVQGYAYAARRGLASLLEAVGDADGATAQRRAAAGLRDSFERTYWSDDLGTYILARQRDGTPCDVVTSNAGQVLWSGIASDEHARRTAERLMRDDMYGGWGIRTLSADAVAFNPIGYHLGTVWPHDNGIVAEGFRRYGLDRPAERVFTALLETAAGFPHFRLPECFAGYARRDFGVPVRYPVACHPQAWAAGSIPHLLTSTLGLEPDALAGRLRVVRPALPDFVDSLELKGVTVGSGSADLRFRDTDQGVEVEVVRADGGLDVRIETGKAAGPARDGGERWSRGVSSPPSGPPVAGARRRPPTDRAVSSGRRPPTDGPSIAPPRGAP